MNERKNNAVIFNMPEPKTNFKVDKIAGVTAVLIDIAHNIGIYLEDGNITKLKRIGKKPDDVNKHRPLLVSFDNNTQRNVFKNVGKLRAEDETFTIGIDHDMTPKAKERN